ncbi:MAG: M20/M25/M40 family metallo-hydrolase [Planctomycetota bacterium]
MNANPLNLKNTTDLRPPPPKPRLSVRKSRKFIPPTRWIKHATELLRLPTSPFHEHNVLLWLYRFARNRGLSAHVDAAGNLRVDYVPKDVVDNSLPRLLFTAHADHTGFWAVAMQDETTLHAQWMGRFPEELIEGGRVVFWTGGKPLAEAEPEFWPGAPEGFRVGGRRVGGVVKKVLGHNDEGDVAGVEIAMDEPVDPGSVGMWDLPDPEHVNGRLSARGVDDVAGCAALACLLDTLIREKSTQPCSCLFTRAEEGGFFGAIRYCRDTFDPPAPGAAAREHPLPDVVISVETSKALPHAPHSAGPVVRVGDRRTLFKPELADWAAGVAGAMSEDDPTFVYQRELMDGGTCESTVFQAWMGNAAALCIPLGNYHNYNVEENAIANEFVHVDDFGNLVRLMRSLVDHAEGTRDTFGGFKKWALDWDAKHAELFTDPAAVPVRAQAVNHPGKFK